MRVAVLHDYFRVIGGAEKLALTLARELGADVVAAEADQEAIALAGFGDVKVTALGPRAPVASLLPALCRRRFSRCDLAGRYDVYVLSGSFSVYAAARHAPNVWYCHSPLRGLYDLKDQHGR
jgi:hypothetical protein